MKYMLYEFNKNGIRRINVPENHRKNYLPVGTIEETLKVLEERGKNLFKKYIPKNAKALIVAEYEEDESDSLTDYYATKTREIVILGYSFHTRDLFSEMRKFADRIPETKHLAEKNPEFEHREKYAFGAGYYLKKGSRYSTGWKIKKIKKYRNDWEEETYISIVYVSIAKRCVFEERNKVEMEEL